jgi:hypothetical protein
MVIGLSIFLVIYTFIKLIRDWSLIGNLMKLSSILVLIFSIYTVRNSMSGGHFDYQNLDYIIDTLTKDIIWNSSNYKKSTVNALMSALKIIKEANVCINRIDYLMSGDDGEDTFIKRLKEELKDLKESDLPIPRCKSCKECKSYSEIPYKVYNYDDKIIMTHCKFNLTAEVAEDGRNCWAFEPEE